MRLWWYKLIYNWTGRCISFSPDPWGVCRVCRWAPINKENEDDHG